MNRRKLIRVGAAGLSGAALAPRAAAASPAARRRQRVLRFAHVTDVHLDPAKRRAPAEFASVLRLLEGMPDRPEFILNGGDAIFDAIARDRAQTAKQWRLWHDIVRAETTLPFLHCIGNHDIWGWRWYDDPGVRTDTRYGKAWALEELGLDSPWYAATRGGWKFIVLDSTRFVGWSYVGRIDSAQFDWLTAELDATPPETPIIIVSHIPIATFAAHIWFGGEPTTRQHEIIHQNLIHSDAVRLKDLFKEHPNVRLCLSGHLHMLERIDYLGVTYACSGAVCGNWWNEERPAFQEFGPAIAMVDCFDDGSFSWEPLAL